MNVGTSYTHTNQEPIIIIDSLGLDSYLTQKHTIRLFHAFPSPFPSSSCLLKLVGAYALFCRICSPLRRNQIGTGTKINATQPSNVHAHWIPIPLNMYVANRGKMAPKRERRKVLAAMADAANCKTYD